MDSSQVPSNKPNAPLPGQQPGHGKSQWMFRPKPEEIRRKYILRGTTTVLGAAAFGACYIFMDHESAYRTYGMIASGLVGLGGLATVVAGLADDYGSGSL